MTARMFGKASLCAGSAVGAFVVAVGFVSVAGAADRPPRHCGRRVAPDPPAAPWVFTRVAELSGAQGPVYSLAWSPDGSAIAAAGYGVVLVWDVEAGEVRHVLRGHTGFVWGVSWSPDGTMIVSGSADRSVRLWRADTGSQIATAGDAWTMCVAWSPDGEMVASGSSGGMIQIWSVPELAPVREWSVGAFVIAAEWSADGDRILVGDLTGRVSVVDAVSGQRLVRVETPVVSNDANGVTWSPDGTQLVSAHQDGTIWMWDADDGSVVRSLDAHGGWARGVSFSPDGRLLVTTGQDQRASVWSTTGWQRLERLSGSSQALWSVDWSPDGRAFAVGSGVYDSTAMGSVYVWEVSGGPGTR